MRKIEGDKNEMKKYVRNKLKYFGQTNVKVWSLGFTYIVTFTNSFRIEFLLGKFLKELLIHLYFPSFS